MAGGVWKRELAARAERWTRGAALPLRVGLVGLVAFAVGASTMDAPAAASGEARLRAELAAARAELTAREGELELARLELRRLSTVVAYSGRHDIPADLAASIYDVAVAEGVEPPLAFSLVRVESSFSPAAVSTAGAVGLAQLMPATAFALEPDLRYGDLFETETNLRLGFRYLRMMLDQYGGDLRLALLAYNRGPGTVDHIRAAGGNPANGYARKVQQGQ